MRIAADFRFFLIAAIVLILSGCGSNPSKPYDGTLKPVENHGRTADAVYYSKQYEAFGTLSGKKEFDKKWTENPGWVLANMSHAAYYDHEQIVNRFFLSVERIHPISMIS